MNNIEKIKIGNKEFDLDLVRRWVRQNDESWISDEADLKYQVEKYLTNRERITAISFIVSVAVGGFLMIQLRLSHQSWLWSTFSATSAAFIAYAVTKLVLRNDNPPTLSSKKFLQDWKDLHSLDITQWSEMYLTELGTAVTIAQRRQDKSRADSIRKQLGAVHSTLLNFGLCKKDWKSYFSSEKPSQVIHLKVGEASRF